MVQHQKGMHEEYKQKKEQRRLMYKPGKVEEGAGAGGGGWRDKGGRKLPGESGGK